MRNPTMAQFLAFIFLLISSELLLTVKPDAARCLATFSARMGQCSHVGNKQVTWETKSICQNLNGTGKCPMKSSCTKGLRLTIFDQQLFALTMKNTFIGMLTRCCQECASCSVVNVVKDNTMLTESILNSSDIIFPVLAESPSSMMQDFHFLTAYNVPSAYYFSLKKTKETIVKEVVAAYLDLWPFLLICLLFALISGFVVWVIEARKNMDEFSSHFCPGMFDGFWWSFIAMTTVGFGDKVTKSYLAKLFAMFWVLLGVSMFSMLTATVTTEIISARSPFSTDMAGKDIAVLKDRIHDMNVVVHHGGILHIGSIGHTMRGIDELVEMVENQTVHGYVIDRNTFHYFTDRIKEIRYKHIGDRIKRLDMSKTEKGHVDSHLKCGMLVKNLHDFRFLKGYFDNNRLALGTCNAKRMNTRCEERKEGNDFDVSDNKLFETVLAYTLVMVGIFVIIGLIVEGRRYCIKRRKVGIASETTA